MEKLSELGSVMYKGGGRDKNQEGNGGGGFVV